VWQGNGFGALHEIASVQCDLEGQEEELRASTKVAKTVRDFCGYSKTKQEFIGKYGQRYQYGEASASGMVESSVKQVESKRMDKKQQMGYCEAGRASAGAGADPRAQ